MRRSSRIQKRSTPSEQQGRQDGVDSSRVRDRLAELNKTVLVPFTNVLKRDPAADISRLFVRNAKDYSKRREFYTKVASDRT
jgi:hypothetical protein